MYVASSAERAHMMVLRARRHSDAASINELSSGAGREEKWLAASLAVM